MIKMKQNAGIVGHNLWPTKIPTPRIAEWGMHPVFFFPYLWSMIPSRAALLTHKLHQQCSGLKQS